MKAVKNLTRLLLICIVSLQSSFVFSQQTLSLDAYIQNIYNFHPYIQITANKLEKATLKHNAAKGLFDPKLKGQWDYKQFKDKTYFNTTEGKLKSNTRLGIAPIVKYQNNLGAYLNPEASNPTNGLVGIGFEIPLLKGLRIDYERKELGIAKAKKDQQVFSNDSTVNLIIAKALTDYVSWATAYSKVAAIQSLFNIRDIRYQNILTMYKGGFLSGMDTLDGFSQLQKTQRELIAQEIELIKTTNKLKNQLWDPTLLGLIDSLIPDGFNEIEPNLIPKNVNPQIDNHNYIESLKQLKKQKQISLIYQKEQFKPTVNLELLPLSAFQDNGFSPNGFSSNNFFTGVQVEIPLWYRKQTNYYKVSKLEVQNIDLKITLAKRKIETSFATYNQSSEKLKQQLSLSLNNIDNLSTLRDLEEQKFNLGESNLIKLNLRENKLIDEQLKTLDVTKKYFNSLIDLNLILQEFN